MRDIHMEKPMDVFIGTKLRLLKDIEDIYLDGSHNPVIRIPKGSIVEIQEVTRDYGKKASYGFYYKDDFFHMRKVDPLLWEVVK